MREIEVLNDGLFACEVKVTRENEPPVSSGSLSIKKRFSCSGINITDIDIGVLTGWIGHKWHGRRGWKHLGVNIDMSKQLAAITISGTTGKPSAKVVYNP